MAVTRILKSIKKKKSSVSGKEKAQALAKKNIRTKNVKAKATAVKKVVTAPARLGAAAGKAVRKRVSKEMDKFEKSGMHQEAIKRHKERLKAVSKKRAQARKKK